MNPPGYIKGEGFLDYLYNYQLFKEYLLRVFSR